MPEVLQRHYGTIVDIEDMRNGDRAAVALNTLLAQDGILVHVARGVHVDRTIQLVQVLNAAAPTLAVRRMLIVLEAGADASLLLCDHTAPGAAASTISQVTEVYLGEDASLSLYTLEESASDTSRLCRTGVRTGRGARLSMTPVTLLCGTSRNNIAVSLEGEGAECNINGMALADGSMVADNNSVVYHKAPRCTTLQNFRYVVDDQARGSFEGMIHVAEGAHHTNGEQTIAMFCCPTVLVCTRCRSSKYIVTMSNAVTVAPPDVWTSVRCSICKAAASPLPRLARCLSKLLWRTF